jgi:hypothetical protein
MYFDQKDYIKFITKLNSFKTLEKYNIPLKKKSIGVVNFSIDELVHENENLCIELVSNLAFDWSLISKKENLKLALLKDKKIFSDLYYYILFTKNQDSLFNKFYINTYNTENALFYSASTNFKYNKLVQLNNIYTHFFCSNKNKSYLTFFCFNFNKFIKIRPVTLLYDLYYKNFKKFNYNFYFISKSSQTWFFRYKPFFLWSKVLRNERWLHITYKRSRNIRLYKKYLDNTFFKRLTPKRRRYLALKKKKKKIKAIKRLEKENYETKKDDDNYIQFFTFINKNYCHKIFNLFLFSSKKNDLISGFFFKPIKQKNNINNFIDFSSLSFLNFLFKIEQKKALMNFKNIKNKKTISQSIKLQENFEQKENIIFKPFFKITKNLKAEDKFIFRLCKYENIKNNEIFI